MTRKDCLGFRLFYSARIPFLQHHRLRRPNGSIRLSLNYVIIVLQSKVTLTRGNWKYAKIETQNSSTRTDLKLLMLV